MTSELGKSSRKPGRLVEDTPVPIFPGQGREIPRTPMRHVVMFSSGAGSWAAAKRVAERHGTSDLTLLFADVRGGSDSPHAGEDEDNYRFLHERRPTSAVS